MDIATRLETVAKDLRYALRQFAHNPVFSSRRCAFARARNRSQTAIFSVYECGAFAIAAGAQSAGIGDVDQSGYAGVFIGSANGERDLLTYCRI